MKWEEYIKESARTDNATTLDDAWGNYTLGLFGEVGEVVELVKKHVYHGHELDAERMREELGDVCWYLAALCRWSGVPVDEPRVWTGDDLYASLRSLSSCAGQLIRSPRYRRGAGDKADMAICYLAGVADALDMRLGDVLQANIDKLRARYPDGWSEEASQRREA